MKRKEILMLVCAFFLGFFANAIMKSIRIGKLYEGVELDRHVTEEVGCVEKMHHFHSHSQQPYHHHFNEDFEDFYENVGCIITSNNPSNNPTVGPGS